MIRGAAILVLAAIAAMLLAWLFSGNAEGRRHRDRHRAPAADVQTIDVGPKVIRSIRISPCEMPYNFAVLWKCRVE